jgi:HAD superfamily hydrolase (TIGR01490 family)
MKLALFDLDHTLLNGDSDVLWCEFLMKEGVLERATFEPRNRDMEARYQAGTVSVAEFCGFFVGTLAGRSPAQWQPVREKFMREEIAPRLPPTAHALVAKHQAVGDTVVLTTATNRFITELTAQHLGIAHLLATECELDALGRFTGRVEGTPNMREGKPVHLNTWLAPKGLTLARCESTAYSDSMNDLPLLEAATHPICANPDARLAALAAKRGWPVIYLFMS